MDLINARKMEYIKMINYIVIPLHFFYSWTTINSVQIHIILASQACIHQYSNTKHCIFSHKRQSKCWGKLNLLLFKDKLLWFNAGMVIGIGSCNAMSTSLTSLLCLETIMIRRAIMWITNKHSCNDAAHCEENRQIFWWQLVLISSLEIL